MANMLKIIGVAQVLKNLSAFKKDLGLQFERNMIDAGLFIQAESQKQVPIKYSLLKNSAFTRNVGGRGFNTDVVVGYTMDYALYVHEIMENSHRSPTKAKYLEDPIKENMKRIMQIIGKRV